MKSSHRCLPFHTVPTLVLAALAAAATIVLSVGVSRAQTLAYSFETDTDGFAPNGAGITVEQDTIGATEGLQSLKVSIVAPATFVGALTANLDPNIFGDPPGLDHVLFDMTIPELFPEPGFAVVGVTVFGATQPDYPGGQQFGLQAQFLGNPPGADEFQIGGLVPATYSDVRINLTAATHPLTFEENQSFNDIFGTVGSDPNDMIPTGFQFYFNKSDSTPLTVYIDNVRFGMAPAAVDGDYNANGVVDAADYTVWRDNFGLMGGATSMQGDGTGDGNVMEDDYIYWRTRFGNIAGGATGSASAVPEPSSAVLLIVASACWWRQLRGRAIL